MTNKNKVLLFVPYQDEDNFYSDGILTREYAMLYALVRHGYQKVISVKKPRTLLDRRRYHTVDSNYPEGTVENQVKSILDEAATLQYLPPVSLSQILKRRNWWVEGYAKTIRLLEPYLDFEQHEYLVYSDNPFASKLLRFLKERGCRIYFDVMDNFAIHPSLNDGERVGALRQYKAIFEFADVISANSAETCHYMEPYTDKRIVLVKNGVFAQNAIRELAELAQIRQIKQEKCRYKRCVGYIGKLGLRLDADLIEQVSRALPETLFVFVGDYLKGQINEKLLNLFEEENNVVHIKGIPSAYVYAVLDEFDVLSIPHAVGKNENGGDPLKLYQYLTRRKPVITTPILGVSEFEDYIRISDSADEWIRFIQDSPEMKAFPDIEAFSWESRLKPIMEVI